MSTQRHRNQQTKTSAAPGIREIAELTARLRTLTTAGPGADPRERAAFLTDKAALLARITADEDGSR